MLKTIFFTVLSLNAIGLNHPAKRASLWNTALAHNSDVLCVQETHFRSDGPPLCQHKYFPHMFKANFTKKKREVMIAIKDTVTFQLHHSILDPNGRYIVLICSINAT